ncbi:MAG TPA: RNA polymerase sigma factor [Burkholderiales bacterium]|jgi:RNA polymerase sigma-70 factor (ECF subfamily)
MAQPAPLAIARDTPDAELAHRVHGGDTAAFEILMRRYNRTLFRTARAILRDDAEAEDALQEAYLQAYQAIGGWRGEAKLSTWLARIVANEALMRLRKQARRAEIVPLQSSATLEGLNEIPDTDMKKTPDREAERLEMRRLLETQIDALPDDYRAVFMLRAVEELTVEETAKVLGIPEATVRSRLFRARSLLREGLASRIDLACEEAFAFAGERCDRIVANVMKRLR